MKFDEDQHRYLLGSGRSFYAHMDALSVWDGKLVSGFDDEVPARLDDPEELTAEERRDIAEHMIERWRRWAGMGWHAYDSITGRDLGPVDGPLTMEQAVERWPGAAVAFRQGSA